tara:strand:- start:309 stop:875 length:567 start_codon:yes stop_codon:yes gene_type:complete
MNTLLATAAVALGFATIGPATAPPPPEVVEIPVVEKTWKCPDCTPNEQYVLSKLQEKTKIRDRNALATIMGNIQQESKFIPDICEGGARVPYGDCRIGGYGLIQWTSVGRYRNLGLFSERFGYDPSTLEGQTAYMINESVFQQYLPEFEGRGHTISQYMVPAFYWLGWGIKGARETYAHQYYKQLVWA